MKIRKLTPENHQKVSALLRQAFANSRYEERLIDALHKKNRSLYEWVCIHKNMYIGYIAFSNAYNGKETCGLHLAPLAVNPQYQNQGVGSELLRFALRQEKIQQHTLFVLGDPDFYRKFGFTPCATPTCPFDTDNVHFLSIRNNANTQYTVGYEPEFGIAV